MPTPSRGLFADSFGSSALPMGPVGCATPDCEPELPRRPVVNDLYQPAAPPSTRGKPFLAIPKRAEAITAVDPIKSGVVDVPA